MKVVYIAGAYRGDGKPDTIYENIQIVRKYAKKYWRLGYAVFCPHMNSAFMDGACSDETFLEGSIEILKRCDVIVMLPNWEQSAGSVDEFNLANDVGLQIIHENYNGRRLKS